MNNAGVQTPAVRGAKAELRRLISEKVRAISPERRAEASLQASRLLTAQPAWQRAQFVMFYAPRADELDVSSLLEDALRQGKRVALPQFDRESKRYRICEIHCPLSQIPAGYYGIREPGTDKPSIPANQLDFILVPGVAFDLSGRRLGRGRGYYDQLLTGVQSTKCGLGFDEQVCAQIPVAPHDILLDCILTPTRWWEITGGTGK